jgi:hypothetical protein
VEWYGENMQGTVNRDQQQTTNDHPGDIKFAKVPCWQPFQNLDSQLLYMKRKGSKRLLRNQHTF